MDTEHFNSELSISNLHERVAEWVCLWQLPAVAEKVSIEFSKRLKRTLGLAQPATGLIRLNPVLLYPANETLLDEILCHETAHVAVFERYGIGCRAHGPEWRELFTVAGFRPRIRIPADGVFGLRSRHGKLSYRYEHYCPICQRVYIARRTDHRWRCAHCVQAGQEGRLLVTRHQIGRHA